MRSIIPDQRPVRDVGSTWSVAAALWVASCLLSGCTCGAADDEVTDGTDHVDVGAEVDAVGDAGGESGDVAEPEDAALEDGTREEVTEEFGPPRDIHCGNGVLDRGEECDDGNRLNGDGCDWLCRWGSGEDPPEPWPDPSIARAVPETAPTEVDLGVENPNYLDWGGGGGTRPPLVSDGRSYATVWPHPASMEEDSPIEGTFVRFHTDGHRRDAPWTYRLAVSHFRYISVSLLDLAWSGSGYGLLWAGREVVPPGEGPGISFMALDPDGKPVAGPVSLSSNGDEQSRLGIAWDGVGYGCLGEMFEPGDGYGTLGILRVTSLGERRDPRRHLLEDAGRGGRGTNAFASSGELYVVAWTGSLPDTGESVVRYGVAAADGTPYGTAQLAGPVVYGAPDVTWSGSEFGIAWFGPGVVERLTAIWFARLSARGELLAPPRRVFYPIRYYSTMALTFGHGTYAVGFWTFDNTAHLVRLDRNGAFFEHVISSRFAEPLSSPSAVAADDLGFGILGATFAPGTVAATGPPVFTWFRVVSP